MSRGRFTLAQRGVRKRKSGGSADNRIQAAAATKRGSVIISAGADSVK